MLTHESKSDLPLVISCFLFENYETLLLFQIYVYLIRVFHEYLRFPILFFHQATNSPSYSEYQSDLFSRLEKAIGSLFYISIYSRVKFVAATTIESYVYI